MTQNTNRHPYWSLEMARRIGKPGTPGARVNIEKLFGIYAPNQESALMGWAARVGADMRYWANEGGALRLYDDDGNCIAEVCAVKAER